MPRRKIFEDRAANLRRIDSAVAEVGYTLRKKQPPPTMHVMIRRYKNDYGHNISLAFTEDDLLLPATEIGLMVQARIARALSTFIKS
jgi:hypothetical protein